MASTINGTSTGSGGLISTGDDSGILNIQTNETTAIAINAAQNVGIGTSSPSSPLNVVSASSSLAIAINGRSSDNLGAMYFYANNGSTQHSTITASATEFRLSSVPAAAVQTFYTNGSERMRIDSSGNLRVGATSGNADARATIEQGSTDGSPCIDYSKGSATTTTAQVYARFFCGSNTIGTGSITANGVSAATFTAYSDRRLKENIVDLPSQLANIMALRPVEFDYKGYPSGKGYQIGFIAQEVQSVYPDLVAEGDNGMLTLSDMNKNDARLIKCIQEQQALINALTARIVALDETLTEIKDRFPK